MPNPFVFSFRSDTQTRSFSAILLRTPKYLCCPQISQNSESHRKASKLMKSKIFQSLKTAAAVSCALLGAALLTACSDGKKVGDVSLGFLTFKNIQIDAFIDPQVPGVTCHAASIESPLTLADPSDSSVSCRQTGEITQAMIDAIDKSKDGEVIFTKSKSIFFKYMKIRRIYDAEIRRFCMSRIPPRKLREASNTAFRRSRSGVLKPTRSPCRLWETPISNNSDCSQQ